MILYKEPFFKFSFADCRQIQRIHLAKIPPETAVLLYHNPGGDGPPLATGCTDEQGWVNLNQKIIVASGDCFYAFPQPDRQG